MVISRNWATSAWEAQYLLPWALKAPTMRLIDTPPGAAVVSSGEPAGLHPFLDQVGAGLWSSRQKGTWAYCPVLNARSFKRVCTDGLERP